AAAARAAGDRVLICVGAEPVPEPVLARLLGAGGTAAFTRLIASTPPCSSLAPRLPSGALVVDLPDLDALARSAETLAATQAGPDPGTAVGALIGELGRRGVTVRILDAAPDSEGAVTQLLAPAGLLPGLALYAALATSSGLGHSAALDGTFGGALRNTFVAAWGGAGATGVWRLAIAALLVLGLRKLAELGYEYTARAPGD